MSYSCCTAGRACDVFHSHIYTVAKETWIWNHQPKLEDEGRQTKDTLKTTYCVGDVVDHDGGLGSPVVHGRQAVISLLSGSVPDLKLHCCVIQTYRLCEEGSWKESHKEYKSRNSQKSHPQVQIQTFGCSDWRPRWINKDWVIHLKKKEKGIITFPSLPLSSVITVGLFPT